MLLTWRRAASGPVEIPAASASLDRICEGTTDDIHQAFKADLCAVTNDTAVADNLANGTTYYFWLADKNGAVSNMAQATPMAALGASPNGLTA